MKTIEKGELALEAGRHAFQKKRVKLKFSWKRPAAIAAAAALAIGLGNWWVFHKSLGTGGGGNPEETVAEVEETAVPSPTAAEPSDPVFFVDLGDTEVPSPTVAEPLDSELVPVLSYIPDLYVDLRYAGEDNFTGKTIYTFDTPWLRYGTVKKLRAVQESLSGLGYSLLVWDAFRPVQAQFDLWAVVPDGRYVANPHTGHSSHSNGGTVDIALVTAMGAAVPLPSGFDEFSTLADRDYSDIPEPAAANARLLQTAMEAQGFQSYSAEWWHYSDGDAYPYEDLEKLVLPESAETRYTPLCEEYISLRTEPDYGAARICKVPLGATLDPIGFCGEFVRVVYGDQEGYVAAAYVTPLPGAK